MKPTFALNITESSIELLHRTPKGWFAVGDTPFDAPDLDEALEYLRKTALGLEPGGIATKLVIPNSQILYTEVVAPGPTDAEREAQIRTALEGRTPYAVEDLVFDWTGKGTKLKVAVVARETLAEAEGFAATHKLNPVSFVAMPENGAFTGEPWFGPSSAAATILAPGETVERDKHPIAIVARELPQAKVEPPAPPPPPVEVAAAPVAEPDPVLAAPVLADPPPAPEAASPEPVTDFLASAIQKAATAADSAPAPVAEPPAPPPVEAAAEVEAPFADVSDAEEDAAPRPVLVDPSVEDDIPPAPPAAAMAAFASRRSADALGGAPSLRPDPATLARAARGKPIEDLPPMPRPPQAPAARNVGPVAAGTGPAMPKGLGGLVGVPSLPGGRKVKGKPAAVAADAAKVAPNPADAARSLSRPGGTFGSKQASRGKPRHLGLILTAILLLCLALIAAWSSFYLASRDAKDPVAVAEADATASDVPGVDDEMLADQQDPEALDSTGDVGDVSAVDPEAALDDTGAADVAALPEDQAAEAPLETAAAPEATTEVAPAAEVPAAEVAAATTPDPAAAPEATAEVAPVAEVPVAPAPEPAPDTALATESPSTQILSENQDEIFLAASDTPPPALDALSLPPPDSTADALPGAQMPPPPFGTVYAFDENGLLKPTPEGILSPEGVLLIAGKPPLLPPARSATAEAAAVAAKTVSAAPAEGAATLPAVAEAPVAAEPAAQPDPDLADRRPRSRPEGLVPAAKDDAALAVEGETAVTSLRPRSRPQTILAAGEKARQETEAASLTAQAAKDAEVTLASAAVAEADNPSVVAISRRPAARPKDFSRAVEAAVAAAVRTPDPAPEPEPEAVAKAEPEAVPDLKPEEQDEINEPEVASSVAPKIPTKANVAKQATYANAINLSKINLIGVYGTQSKRYALIRQANGKYKKVKVGDRIDGGTIQAITETEVRYQKGGRLVSLKMPKA